ncbi:MAG: hypothetical protein ACXV2C_00385 [Candidatus Bathyarchaeia archaeon]
MRFLIKAIAMIALMTSPFWVTLVGVAFAGMDAGPTASDIKAAMVRVGITAGRSFELNGKNYTLHNIAVSKQGVDTFVVSLQTVPE